MQQALAAHILAAPPPERLVSWLAVPPASDPLTRLAVYADGYPARLEEALAEQFPSLVHLVGASRFHALVQRYITRAELTSYSLNDAGADLSRVLCDDPLAAELPFLPDLAALEWRVVCAFHAAELPAPDLTPLAGWQPDDWAAALVRLQPAVAVVRSDWPLRALWEARDTPLAEIDIDLRAPDHVLVRRDGHAVVCESIDAGEAGALALLAAGRALGDVAAELLRAGHDGDAVLAWFAGWARRGMIAAIASPD